MTTDSNPPPNIERFREPYRKHLDKARAELVAGRKRSHWMWFIFPQVAGLGRSPESQLYAFNDFFEAVAFFMDGEFFANYTDLVSIVHGHLGERTPRQIFGETDSKKLRSSLTIFVEIAHQWPGASDEVAMANDLIEAVGGPCLRTVEIIRTWLGV